MTRALDILHDAGGYVAPRATNLFKRLAIFEDRRRLDIFPARPERCLTPVVDPNERALAASLAALYDGVGVFGRWPGRPGADTWRCGRP